MFYNSVPYNVAKYNDDFGRACPITHSFSSSSLYPNIQTVKQSLADVGLHTVKMVYIDNSTSQTGTTIVFGGTRQVITVPGYTQGYYRVLGSPIDLDYTITNYSGLSSTLVNVNLIWMNTECEMLQWSTQYPVGLEGIPFAYEASASNAAISYNIPNKTGLTFLLTGLCVTGLGATSATGVTLYVTNIGQQGNSTMSYYIGVPAGVTTSITPFFQSYSPPIAQTSSSLITNVSLAAFGAGNTAATLQITGLYV